MLMGDAVRWQSRNRWVWSIKQETGKECGGPHSAVAQAKDGARDSMREVGTKEGSGQIQVHRGMMVMQQVCGTQLDMSLLLMRRTSAQLLWNGELLTIHLTVRRFIQ